MPAQQPQSSLVSAITDQPMLVAPECDQLFTSLMQELAGNEEFGEIYDACHAGTAGMRRDDDDDFWGADDPWVAAYRPYNVVKGVLQIPVFGVLLNRFSFQFGRRATGYQYIEKAFNRGMDDPEVKAIAFVHDSPGGEVAGNFELVDKINARTDKPTRAFAADHSYSASYSLASAANQIVMSRSGGVGSVGVVVAHVEMSERLKDWGIKVTFIFAGKHKVDGNQYEKLSDTAKTRIKAKVDRIYGEFTALVATNRDMEEQAVRDTEALTFDASDAIEVGFADRVGALEEELAVFQEEAAETENPLMAKTPTTPTAAPAADGQFTQAQLDAAVTEARAEGAAEGATAERDRMNAIMGSEEAKTRPQAAKALAETGMDAEQAVATLAKMPTETAETPAPAPEAATPAPAASTPAPAAPAAAPAAANGFANAMAQTGNPGVGAEEQPSGEPTAEEQSAAILGSLQLATGRKPKDKAA